MNSKPIMFIGPRRSPVTGQSEAFQLLFSSKLENELFLHFPPGNLIFPNIVFLTKLILHFLSYRPASVYLSISRTPLGFLRDALVIWLSRWFKAKLTVHLHGADFNVFYQSSSKPFKWLIRKSYERVAVGIVLGNSMYQEFEAFPNLVLHSVPNAASQEIEEQAKNTNDKCPLIQSPLKVLYLSNLIPSKGILELIDAVEILWDEGLEIELDICGRMGFSDLVDDKVNRVRGLMRYNGAVHGHRKIEFLKKADIVCLPSYYPTEAQPLSLIEAMHFGCAIIFSDHNYLPEFFSTDFGFCVPVQNSNAIADSLRFYSHNPDILNKHGTIAREHANLLFNRTMHCSKIRKIIFDNEIDE